MQHLNSDRLYPTDTPKFEDELGPQNVKKLKYKV